MKAILMTSPGSPEVLQVHDVPPPQIRQARELLIRLKAAGINPIDTKLRQRGTFYPEQMPAILGCDGAGVVEAVGSGVQQFRVGDEVYFCNGGLGGHPGNYAEFAIVDERFAALKPSSIGFTEAAAAPLVLITAWEALYDRARLEAGRKVLIHAGAGGVGHVAIQLAKLAGATVCTTVSTPEKAKFVRQLGADHVIFYRETDPIEAVLNWTNGEGVDLAFDTIGGQVLSQSFAQTAVYGDVVTILAPDSQTDWKTARDRNLRVSYELMLTPMLRGMTQAQQDQAKILRQCAHLIDQKDLMIYLNRTFPLAEAAAAHRLLEMGSLMGKLVLLTEP
ncbi:zinc-binding dehydrogenase [Leptolyngbya sp. FACHB-711]|uniref:zinc-binding dehydrogenase n=1 Tax=unclassified Leptolyngbya TaxID=2650499 RepID=UPI0016886FF1|nr:zinc-dependent alcohol dehydrogenase family protein [Cyanobacteria bacterium FACHB-502]MBD2027465.1 zinc-dependent alcohol dehydrogenase family protein [Leptolyngbya sp. FACHB-711]